MAGAATASVALAGAVRAEGGLLPAAKPMFAVGTPIHVGQVALAVKDLRRVAWFYSQVIGLEILLESDDEVHLGVDGVVLLVLEHRPDASPVRPTQAGLYHTAFLMPTRTDLARWLVHSAAMGYPLTGFADHLVSEAIYLDDPEGNGVEIYADRDPEGWAWDGESVSMGSEPLDVDGLLFLVPTDRDTFSVAASGTRIGHVHLRGGDVDSAKGFYSDLLGLDVVRAGDDAVFMSSGRYHHHIAVNAWQSAGAGRRNPKDAGLLRLRLHAKSRDPIEGIRTRFDAAGRELLDTGDLVSVEDPWGTRIEVALINRA